MRIVALLAALLAGSFSFAPAGAAEPTDQALFDHLVYAAPDLQAASDRIHQQLGVEATPGGRHPRGGTANALLSLGGRQYLEIIAPDASQPKPRGAGARIAKLSAPQIVTFATEQADLEAVAAKAKQLGLKTSGIRPGSRKTPAGELLEWRTLGIAAPKQYAGLMPFFIDWRDTPHPSQTSAQGARLVSIVVTHPEPAGLRKLYRAFGVRVPVRAGERPSITAEIEHGAKKLTLSGSGRGL